MGYYGAADFVCKGCHSSCFACDGPNEDDCISCADGKLLDVEENVCKDSCDPGKYKI